MTWRVTLRDAWARVFAAPARPADLPRNLCGGAVRPSVSGRNQPNSPGGRGFAEEVSGPNRSRAAIPLSGDPGQKLRPT